MAKKTAEVKGGKKGEEKAEKGKNGRVLPTRKQLDDMRNAIQVTIEGQPMVGTKREFESGSVGYNINGKIVIDGLVCQVSANITAVGSKQLARMENA